MHFAFVQSVRHSASLAADIDEKESGSGSDYGDWENDDWSMDGFAFTSTTKKESKSKLTQSTKVAAAMILMLLYVAVKYMYGELKIYFVHHTSAWSVLYSF